VVTARPILKIQSPKQVSTTIDDWSDFFPPTSEGVRPDQEKTINFILDRVKDGITNIFLEAPTGTGKSYLAWTVAQFCAAEMGWRTRILVPNLYLEDQYCRDFSRLGMLRLESARHYQCPEFSSCDVGRGSEVIQPPPVVVVPENSGTQEGSGPGEPTTRTVLSQSASRQKCKDQNCSYLKARGAFAICPVGVSNTAYALTCARFGHPFVSGDFLVADEAHNLADQISGLYEVTIDCSLIAEGPAVGQEFAWLKAIYLPTLNKRIAALQIAIDRPGAPTTDVMNLTSRLAKCTNEAANIGVIISTPEDEWVISRPPGSIKVQPLWSTRVAPKLLNFLAPRRLFMSGTFLDYNHHVASLGL
jgi:ATP-dependent DNA helicase DinG